MSGWTLPTDTGRMRAPRVLLLGAAVAMDAAGTALPVGGPRRRGVLAFLAIRAPRAATRAEIVDALWGDAPPAEAANAVQAHVSALRRAFWGRRRWRRWATDTALPTPSTSMSSRLTGCVGPVGTCSEASEHAAASEPLRAALGLWRGRALADLETVAFAPSAAVLLEEKRLAAYEWRFEADLAAGRPEDTLAELEALHAEHHARESLAAQLMRARYTVGRQAEALAVYSAVRDRLHEDLGVEPSASLRDLRRRLVNGSEPLPAAALPRRRALPCPSCSTRPSAVRPTSPR